MKRILIAMLVVMFLVPLATVAAADGNINWNHINGADGGELDCTGYVAANPDDGWLHWVLGGARDVTFAEIQVNGGEWVRFDTKQGNNIDFFTEPYYTPSELESITVTVRYTGTLGTGANAIIKLSHHCPGSTTDIPEFPTIVLPIAAILGLAFFIQRRKE